MNRSSVVFGGFALLAVLMPAAARAQAGAARAAGPPAWERALLGQRASASDAFTCEASTSTSGGRWSGTCFHPSLAALRSAEQAAGAGAGFTTRVCAALERQQATVPAGAMEMSASGSVAPGQTLPDSVSVYYFLYLPFQTTATLGISDRDPGDGNPWLHHAGTCSAHLMWNEVRALPDSMP